MTAFDTAEMTARHVAACRRLAEAAEALAMMARGQAEAPDATPEQVTAATHAFHRAARSSRQSMALEAKLVRERLAEARWQAQEAERREAMASGKVRQHVRVGDRLVFHEGDKADPDWAMSLLYFPGFDDGTGEVPEDPAARLFWLQSRARQAEDDLAAARAAQAEGRPIPFPRRHFRRRDSG